MILVHAIGHGNYKLPDEHAPKVQAAVDEFAAHIGMSKDHRPAGGWHFPHNDAVWELLKEFDKIEGDVADVSDCHTLYVYYPEF